MIRTLHVQVEPDSLGVVILNKPPQPLVADASNLPVRNVRFCRTDVNRKKALRSVSRVFKFRSEDIPKPISEEDSWKWKRR